jgi:protein-L-isoaspartate(D-aspartate) O-methyltransferase
MNVDIARFNMIEQQIRPWNVMDASVLELLSLVKREDFVPKAQQRAGICRSGNSIDGIG